MSLGSQAASTTTTYATLATYRTAGIKLYLSDGDRSSITHRLRSRIFGRDARIRDHRTAREKALIGSR
jgi:hypothetical protein